MPSEVLALGLLVLIVAVVGVVIGMLVAPLVGRLAGDGRSENEGDGSDGPT